MAHIFWGMAPRECQGPLRIAFGHRMLMLNSFFETNAFFA